MTDDNCQVNRCDNPTTNNSPACPGCWAVADQLARGITA